MAQRLSDIIVNQDIFGHQIGVHYQGSDTFKTKLGALITVLTYTLIIANFLTLVVDFKDNNRWEIASTELTFDRFNSDNYTLADNRFEIKLLFIGQTPLTEDYGRWRAFQSSQSCKAKNMEEMRQLCLSENRASAVEISIVDCTDE